MNRHHSVDKLFWFLIGILLGIVLIDRLQKLSTNKEIYLQDKKIDTTFVLSKEAVFDLCVECDVEYPEIVTAQAVLETGHFTSRVCRENKNIFGFFNGKRYLEFNSYKECVEFYKSWQQKKYKGGDYYKFLEELPYAEDTLYVHHLKQMK
jgi:uncharacterized FlgJ-related protein